MKAPVNTCILIFLYLASTPGPVISGLKGGGARNLDMIMKNY